ncbi:MAG: hypothetical protein KJP09_07775 [Bacteroidia bacterium]|nr:hypothetical protein [Bacteroidia bacterium]NNK26761.1 hypothetical protein [Flavobacteriaceae bacterium]RZV58829.1 MAG: hypothetical protein EX254_09915 [Flavobacteriaceae bacterium]
MKTEQTYPRYVEWLSAEEMHNASREWLSELRFMKDEHHFYEDLITSFTMQMLEQDKFPENKKVIDAINHSKKRTASLIDEIMKHEKELEIMVDGIDQPKEESAYKEEHRRLIAVMNQFIPEYRNLKGQLFGIIKDIRIKEKQSRLIDRK